MIISPQRLAVLAHLAGQSAPVQRAAICSALGIRSGNIEAVLRPLIADRLIREVPRKHDTRNYAPLVAIAPAGRRALTPDAPPAETPVKAAPKPRVSDAGLSVLRFLRAEENAGRKAVHGLERYLNALGTIAAAAPLLGLLGTVVGMIEIFGSQGGASGGMGSGNPAQLAHGISVALYNTAFGLIVAIPALIFWRYFRGRVDAYLLTLELSSEQFVRHLLRLRSK
mgnify:CR=1 FL=1